MRNYQDKDIKACLRSKHLVFIGDSVTRQLYFQAAHALDASMPVAPTDDERKHVDYDLTTSQNVRLTFIWDPFLNTSSALSYIRHSSRDQDLPGMLVLGSGLWYLRYADSSGGLPAWEAMMENTLATLSASRAADLVAVLPIEHVVPSKLSPERAATMHASDIDAMNSDLAHRIRPPSSTDPFAFFMPPGGHFGGAMPVTFPSVFNEMLDPSQTEDGLHFSPAVVKMQASILLNLRCNDVLPKKFPFDTTCCMRYPWPFPLHLLLLAATVLCGPISWFLARRYSEYKCIRPQPQTQFPRPQDC